MRGRGISTAPVTSAPALNLLAKRPRAMMPYSHNINDFGQLQNYVATRLEALKKDMDDEHASRMKEIDAESAKLKKRLKHETESLTTISEAIETDWRSFLADCEEDTRENQASVEVLISKVDASTTHFSKNRIPELLKSVEMSLDNIKNRHCNIRSGKIIAKHLVRDSERQGDGNDCKLESAR